MMDRQKLICGKLLDIFRVLAISSNMPYWKNDEVTILISQGKKLLHITSTSLSNPVNEISDTVLDQSSPLADSFVSMEAFEKFIALLQKNGPIKGLDHVGFCYTVDSQEDELTKIKKVLLSTQLYLYEMESTDVAKWYFIGDRSHEVDPMLEFLPVLLNKTLLNNDPALSYWMPHIQIDMETSCSAAKISEMMHEIFGETRKPIFQIDPGSGVYAVRMWLGTISGINIMLDIGTNIVSLPWVRANMLRELK
jgi:hypothetical protein